MEDKQIVDLYWSRSETAISETAIKYGRYCYYIAHNILHNNEDSEECVNDTYLNAWNVMPDQRPSKLSTFLGKITRNLSLNRWELYNAEKRGSGQIPLALHELHECIPSTNSADHLADDLALAEILNRFLAALPKERRMIFMRRYWYLSPIAEIAADYSMSESKVKMSLLRSRNALKQVLEEEGIDL